MSNFKLFRLTAFLEGLSYILLLGVAMPLKYIWDMPQAVSIIGLLHGWLFVFYLALLYWQNLKKKWKRSDNVWAILASLLPFGTFIADSKIYQKYAGKIAA